jgi:hypothetical protein
MPTRPTALVLLSYLALFLGAGVLGGLLARGLAPESWPAEVVGFFALPVAFAIGLQLWFGLALLSVIPRLLRRRPGIRPAQPKAALSGGFVLVPLSSLAGALAGVAIGMLSRIHAVWWLRCSGGEWIRCTDCWPGGWPGPDTSYRLRAFRLAGLVRRAMTGLWAPRRSTLC